MARPREFDYEQVLDGALQLFWRGGYEATSLDGLLNEVGLSKSSFYGAFGSKHEMLLAALDRYIETVLQANIDDLRRGSPREAIIRSFEKILGFSLLLMPMPASFRPFLSQISMGCSFWRAPISEWMQERRLLQR